MKWFEILETSNSYTETLNNYTKLNDTERPQSEVIKNNLVGNAIVSKKWTRKDILGNEIVLDFTTGKNYYNEIEYGKNGSMNVRKMEYKIAVNGDFYNRFWNSSYKSYWDKQAVVSSATKLKLGVFDYTLK